MIIIFFPPNHNSDMTTRLSLCD